MEISTKYTLQNWRTDEMDLYDIPEEVLTLNFERVLKQALWEIGCIELNIIELLFGCIFLNDDFQVVRTPLNSNRPVYQIFTRLFEGEGGNSEALVGPGVPDFFIRYPTGQHYFVEIKASEGTLNSNQKEWADTYDQNFLLLS